MISQRAHLKLRFVSQTETRSARSSPIVCDGAKGVWTKSETFACEAARRKGSAEEDAESARRAKCQTRGHISGTGWGSAYIPAGPGRAKGREGVEHRDQTKEEGQGGQVCGAVTEGSRDCGGRDVQGDEDGEEQEQVVEADGDEGDVRWGGLHAETGENGEICAADGVEVPAGERDAS